MAHVWKPLELGSGYDEHSLHRIFPKEKLGFDGFVYYGRSAIGFKVYVINDGSLMESRLLTKQFFVYGIDSYSGLPEEGRLAKAIISNYVYKKSPFEVREKNFVELNSLITSSDLELTELQQVSLTNFGIF